jgi:RNA polymerase sigma-70 factor (ECF subfamily)
MPMLERWAHGRLPASARSLADTPDLVQITLARALEHLGTFEPRREGAFLAYLRTTLMNLLRNEINRAANRTSGAMPEDPIDGRQSPLDEQIGREALEAYEGALTRLPEQMREAVILKLEFGYDNRQIAEAIGRKSPNAARMLVSRALVRLARDMDSHR